MNLELLKEIHNLQNDGISEAEIASSLGMQKNILMINLRMEKIISDKYENVVEENKRLISYKNSYLEDIDKLKKRLSKQEEKINLLKSNDYIQEINFLKKELDNERDYNLEYERMQNKYERIPKFIKRWF